MDDDTLTGVAAQLRADARTAARRHYADALGWRGQQYPTEATVAADRAYNLDKGVPRYFGGTKPAGAFPRFDAIVTHIVDASEQALGVEAFIRCWLPRGN